MSFVTRLRCIDCGKEFAAEGGLTVCDKCGQKGLFHGMLDPVYDYTGIMKTVTREVLEKRAPGLWKYSEFMPLTDKKSIVTMGEGGTPLVRASNLSRDLGIENLYLKNETMNPSFSFKDRPCSLTVSKAVEEGSKTVALMSDGNNGAAAAAYAARAGLDCYIFMPASSVPDKITQILFYGAQVVLVDGFAFDAGILLLQACPKYGWTNITQIKVANPYPSDAHRSVSYEICEQLGWKSPDWLITPIASGDSIGGQWKGYKEFCELGFVDKKPRMVGVQGVGADPVVQAFTQNKEWYEVEPFEPETICDALVAGNVVGNWALNSLRESDGQAIASADEETLDAYRMLAEKEGIFVEPSSAVPLVGLKKLLDKGMIRKNDIVVLVLTGAGMKLMEHAARSVTRPEPIPPTIEALDKKLSGEKKR
jgi:threonine synthase